LNWPVLAESGDGMGGLRDTRRKLVSPLAKETGHELQKNNKPSKSDAALPLKKGKAGRAKTAAPTEPRLVHSGKSCRSNGACVTSHCSTLLLIASCAAAILLRCGSMTWHRTATPSTERRFGRGKHVSQFGSS